MDIPINGDQTVSLAQQLPYSISVTQVSSIVWTVDKGMIVGGQGTQTITVNWNQPGSGSVSVVVNFTTGDQNHGSVIIIIDGGNGG